MDWLTHATGMLWTENAGNGAPSWFEEEEPLRAELFSAQQMSEHGVRLARMHRVQSGRVREALLARLVLNEKVLIDTTRLLSETLRADHSITPAGEWLLDNFYLIDENIRIARRHLPLGYSRELPRLAEGASAGLPRVYDIALEAISHGDGRISQDSMQRFIAAYQTVTPLTLGELWAVPIMLRLALIENLRRVAARVAAGRMQRNLANTWADQMLAVAASDPKNLIVIVADMARSNPPTTSAFVAELSRRLKGQGHALLLPLTWIDQHLAESGLSTEQLVQAENQQQAADQVSISNSINSLRLLSVSDWSDFVEALSVVETALRRDPAGAYAGMDFASRDRYRHCVEKLARTSRVSEQVVVERAIALAQAALGRGESARRTHIGFYLIDAGSGELETAIGIRSPLLRHFNVRVRGTLFFGTLLLLTVIIAGSVTIHARALGVHGSMLAAMTIFAAIAGSQLALAVVNRLATMLTTPAPLARMDFSKGVPAQLRTLVVVPTLLNDLADVDRLIEALEVRFLANRDESLLFGLLTDFADADVETLPGDAPLLREAAEAVAALNRKYASDDAAVFFLFHRPRCWNPHEQVWMGRERKRGKLADLNALLREGRREAFSHIEGDVAALSGVRYVITLDSDTQLPRDMARKLVATMAHVLQQPQYDAQSRRIDVGYGILQPRMSTTLTSAYRSRYARAHAGEAGVDPYTRAVSDVYQDVFGEGTFTGKGIYDVEAFEAMLDGAMPANRILSHDLLESTYVRSGLASDIELYDEFPARYLSDVARRHRWMRGDWQIVGWLLPTVADEHGRRVRNPISMLAQWKVFDNLRRSLVAPALLALTLTGWLLLPQAGYWTLLLLALTLLPALAASLLDAVRKPGDIDLLQHARLATGFAWSRLASALFSLACLPFEAFIALDAIVRTLWRMSVTRRHLLQWVASSEVDRRTSSSFAATLRAMWFAPLVAAASIGVLIARNPHALTATAAVLLLWFVSPLIAWWVSRPAERVTQALTSEEQDFLRDVARRTWAFFERFVTEDDHWLPPDNFQATPATAVAHRTSPTNIGFALLANLTAHDFGYATAGTVVDRTRKTFATLQQLSSEFGHFYNWYDTRTLQPLQPAYVSSVDSGNLAASLLVLQSGLLELMETPIIGVQYAQGLRDTWKALHALAPRIDDELSGQIEHALKACAAAASLPALHDALFVVRQIAEGMCGMFSTAGDSGRFWSERLLEQSRSAIDEIAAFASWATLPTPAATRALTDTIGIPALSDLDRVYTKTLDDLSALPSDGLSDSDRAWIAAFERACPTAVAQAKQRMQTMHELAQQAEAFAQMDFRVLYDRSRHLFSVGYHVADRRLDVSYYDLLASEARLTTYVAIALGQVPQDSWYALGRLLTETADGPTLMSWSGSMFEYLMPMLLAPSYEQSLLTQSCAAAVRRQIAYGAERNVPWGISESGYYILDASLTYQYRAFGVPGLGLKRGLSEDLVIAPYATMLALMVFPHEATQNLNRLAADDMFADFGFYEACDFTPSRLHRGENYARVSSFMAHHQGMGFLALAYALLDRPMQRRFCAMPQLQAGLHLLQERMPRVAAVSADRSEMTDARARTEAAETPIRIYDTGDTASPAVQLLSNGRYHVMLTNAGSGYSRWHDLAVTRWREDTTCDQWGLYGFVRDIDAPAAWSTTWQPMLAAPDSYEATFTEPRVEYRRRDGQIETQTDISVSPEDDIELRRVKIINRSRVRRTIEFTSYAEVVAAAPAGDAAQRGFSNLFVQTQLLADKDAIVCTRRPRAKNETPPWMLHVVKVRRGKKLQTSFETDRMRFLGRGNTLADAAALAVPGDLSGTQGAVLDPIVAVRHRIVLDPDQTVTIDVVCGMTENRDACFALVDKYQDKALSDRVFDLAWTHSQVALRQLNVTEADAQLYGRIASRIIYANATQRADAALIASNQRNQTGLWGYAISGDLPIVLLKIGDGEGIELARQLVQAHAYWRTKGMMVDLVIWNDDRGGYRQVLQDQIMGLIAAQIDGNIIDRPGGIFVRPVDQISPDDRILLQAVARVVVRDEDGALLEQVRALRKKDVTIPKFIASRGEQRFIAPLALPAETPKEGNGFGTFSADGSEYVITTSAARRTPLPWVNVLANPNFGTVVSESGSAYTWAENAHEFRLTPWPDDPVTDASGEALYLRDEETGQLWSPTPLPTSDDATYTTRHGFGYTVFEHVRNGLHSELWIYVDLHERVKYSVLRLRNASGATRRLSATCFVEWVLGDLRAKSTPHIVTELDPQSGAVLARNAFNPEFPGRVAFLDVDDPRRTVTGDRAEFLGRNGTTKDPAALRRQNLSGKTGAAMDPCAAIQVPFELADGKSREIIFRLGAAENIEQASALVLRCRQSGTARDALNAVRTHWRRTLGAVQVKTPDESLDLIANGWLLYQVIASRIWGRSGYYQSGGAWGFRDQLQDAMALVHCEPVTLRNQILLCASRQFAEGDVQHWWHPPTGRGVRTRCSDDYLWLPYAACRYIETTGDMEILHEPVAFLSGRELGPDEESYYDLAGNGDVAPLLEHCRRAITHGLRFGVHGLPLMGSGDWNDGMNNVGIHGKGESVWLAFMLHDVLARFARIAAQAGDDAFAERCNGEAVKLGANIETHAWDGEWYRRAWFDDGTPLGSAQNSECRIDSIAQSWSVLADVGSGERQTRAMQSLDKHLVRRDAGLIQLLDPPFDKGDTDPGYIKGYVPGVRENGGQYTHAAVWATMAFAALGDGQRAYELFAMLNPLDHAATEEKVRTYKVEPYVVAADVYAVAPHVGRGGWTWYTGSAGWMYRLVVESILGIRLDRGRLRFAPCVPNAWNTFAVTYRHGDAEYAIEFRRNESVHGLRVSINGEVQSEAVIALDATPATHEVLVEFGAPT